jgi:hypothetical protein
MAGLVLGIEDVTLSLSGAEDGLTVGHLRGSAGTAGRELLPLLHELACNGLMPEFQYCLETVCIHLILFKNA